MAYEVKEGPFTLLQAEVHVNPNHTPVVLGHAWVKNDELACYDWQPGDLLEILDSFPADPEGVPEPQYFVHNVRLGDDATGWVTNHQITTHLREVGPNQPDWTLPNLCL